jgi:hypothetical protein
MSPNQDLTIPLSSGLDQPLNLKISNVKTAFEIMDRELDKSLTKHDIKPVNLLLMKYAFAQKIVGIALARLLYRMLDKWPELSKGQFENFDECRSDFEQTMFRQYGYDKDTVRRYCQAWAFMESIHGKIPNDVWERFLGRPTGDLVALGQNVEEHGAFKREDLKALAAAEDTVALRKLVTKIRTGKEENSKVGSYLKRDDGTLEYWEGDEGAPIGFLSQDGQGEIHDRGLARLKKRLSVREE